MLKQYVVIYVSKKSMDYAVTMAPDEEDAVEKVTIMLEDTENLIVKPLYTANAEFENEAYLMFEAFKAGYNSDHYHF